MLFRGTTQKLLNSSLFDVVPAFEEEKLLIKRIPPLSLKLQYIYGFQAFEKRRTLFYAHHYSMKKTNTEDLGKEKKIKLSISSENIASALNKFSSKEDRADDDEENIILPNFLQEQLLFSKETPISYDAKHDNCDRYFAYFVSRVAILYSPITNEQKFYEGHKNKITAITMHPSSILFLSEFELIKY